MLNKIIELAIKENKNSRERAIQENHDKRISKIFWLKEFCTIHINLGRQTGKTNYILENTTGEDIVFSVYPLMRQKFKTYLSPDFIDRKELNECKFVFIDEPRLYFNKLKYSFNIDIFEFYSYFVDNDDVVFIMLGE